MSTQSDAVKAANDKLQADTAAAASTKAFGAAVTAEILHLDPATPPPPPPTGFDPRTSFYVPPWTATPGAVDPNSSVLIANWIARGNIKYPNVCTNSYSVAWAESEAADPHYDVKVVTYGVRTIVGVPIPAGTKPSPDSDAHLTIFDNAHQRCIQMWKASFNGTTWSCGSATERSYADCAKPGGGANASGIPNFAVAIWPEEIQAGKINHALGFSTSLPAYASPAHVYPAVSSDGKGGTGDLPEGSWLALPSSVTPNSAWAPWVKVVFTALQQHGMFLMDQGGTLGIAGINPVNGGTKWSDVGMGTGGSQGFPSDFPWAKCVLLSPPAA